MEVLYDFTSPEQVEPVAVFPSLSYVEHDAQSRGGLPQMKHGAHGGSFFLKLKAMALQQASTKPPKGYWWRN